MFLGRFPDAVQGDRSSASVDDRLNVTRVARKPKVLLPVIVVVDVPDAPRSVRNDHEDSSMERGLGARIRSFEDCSGFTRVTAHRLADPPERAGAPEASTARSPLPPPGLPLRCTDTS
jgi:hypothetical protein